jgi:hypothetical protein
MPIKIVYNPLGKLSGAIGVNPISGKDWTPSRESETLLAACKSPELSDEITRQPKAVGDIFITPGYHSGFKKILHIVLPNGYRDFKEIKLKRSYLSVFEAALKEGASEMTLPLLGIDTNGYEEKDSFKAFHKVASKFAAKHPDFLIRLVLPNPDMPDNRMCMRLESERSYGILSGPRVPVITHTPIVIAKSQANSYWDYLVTYIQERTKAKHPIPEIRDESAFIEDLCAYSVSASSMSKWKGKAKAKVGKGTGKPFKATGKRKTKAEIEQESYYYPKPAKKLLFLIVLILDMTYDEAIQCFFAFGYGLSQFEPVEEFYLDTLEDYPRDEDIYDINQKLIDRFGVKEQLFDDSENDLVLPPKSGSARY